MRPTATHIPGEPRNAEPPAALVALSERLQHPLVKRTGITATRNGDWALYVTVPKTTEVPLPDLEAMAQGFPVVYEAEPDEPLVPFRERE